MEQYANLSEAIQACSSDSSCTSIVDYECDSQEFWTCSDDLLPSTVGSCTIYVRHKTGIMMKFLSHWHN